MANRWWASVRETKPRWRNGCLEGGLVHCQILVLSGKGPQGIKEKGTGEKVLGERGLEWSPPASSQSHGGGQVHALPQHQGGIVEPRCSEQGWKLPWQSWRLLPEVPDLLETQAQATQRSRGEWASEPDQQGQPASWCPSRLEPPSQGLGHCYL